MIIEIDVHTKAIEKNQKEKYYARFHVFEKKILSFYVRTK